MGSEREGWREGGREEGEKGKFCLFGDFALRRGIQFIHRDTAEVARSGLSVNFDRNVKNVTFQSSSFRRIQDITPHEQLLRYLIFFTMRQSIESSP